MPRRRIQLTLPWLLLFSGCNSVGLPNALPPALGAAVADMAVASSSVDLAQPRSDLAPAPTCSDYLRNGNESDVDCGGTCGPCDQGKHCIVAADCVTGLCVNGMCSKPIPTLSFGAPISYPADQGPEGIVTGDFNKDGFIDLAVTNDYSYDYSILMGVGDGSFSEPVKIDLNRAGSQVTVSPSPLVSGDFNGDGATDLLATWDDGSLFPTTNELINKTTLLISSGMGTFQEGQSYFQCSNSASSSMPCNEAVALGVGDLNGDHLDDIVVVLGTAVGVQTMIQGPAGSFQIMGPYPVSNQPQVTTRSVALGDLNGDHFLDAVVLDLAYNPPDDLNLGTVDVLLGNGDGSFGVPQRTYVNSERGSGAATGPVALGDFDGDGQLDVAAADKYIVVMLGRGDGTFGGKTIYGAGGSIVALATADFNLDGDMDIVATDSSSGDITVLLGKGDGTFPTSQNFVVGNSPQAIAVADLNHDGRPDLAVANGVDAVILLNTSH